jgi:hypothetical protein
MAVVGLTFLKVRQLAGAAGQHKPDVVAENSSEGLELFAWVA